MKAKLALLAALGGFVCSHAAQPASLQDLASAAAPLPSATIFTAKEIITLDPATPFRTLTATRASG